MTSFRLTGALWVLLSVLTFAGCGGGGGGGIGGPEPIDNGGGGGGGNNNGGAFTGVTFTEDTSLTDDITGTWIMIAELTNEPQTYAVPTTFSGIKRRTVYITREDGVLNIESRFSVFNLVETDSSIEFEFNRANYSLQKTSNTRMTGNSTFVVNDDPIGQITMIKIGPGPASLNDIGGSFDLGTIDLASSGLLGGTGGLDVTCYDDVRGTESFTQNSMPQSIAFEGFTLTGALGGSIIMNRYLDIDYSTLDVTVSDLDLLVESDADGSSLEVDISGDNDNISIEIDAVDGATDGTTLTGSGDLDLAQ